MAIRKIRHEGDEILRMRCKPVSEVTNGTRSLIADMFDTMDEAEGVGLAAPQIGVLRRIVVIDDRDGNRLALVNPVIKAKSGTQTSTEGCLSLPGYRGEVERPQNVCIEALDEYGNSVSLEASDFLAVICCHELDHLDGILYKDIASSYEPIPKGGE